MGSLGDLHPMIALAVELRRRGHVAVINTWEGYEDKVAELGFEFRRLRPNVDPTDRELIRKTMDAREGPEFVIRELMMGNIFDMYDDLAAAVAGADIFVTGEIIYAAASVAEVTSCKWVSTSFAPISMFSAEDPNVYVQADWVEYLRPFPAFFHRGMLGMMRFLTKSWLAEYRKLRRSLNLSENHDPLFRNKFSPLTHLAMFTRALAEPQCDWPQTTIQTGTCFYDESEIGEPDPRLTDFLNNGTEPIVFTLGSAAVIDARDFFDESAKAAKALDRRAILLYGRDNEPPKGLNSDIVGFDYAPYSVVFKRAACVVHQGGAGTTAQVLRAGVPHLIMPYSHDQPDNAARCRRAGVAEIIGRNDYNVSSAAKALKNILENPRYLENAAGLKRIVDSEHGTATACDAITDILRK